MCTFVSSSTVIGSALALRNGQDFTVSQMEALISHIYKHRPDINILVSRDDISEMLWAFNDIIVETDGAFGLRSGSESRKQAQALFFNHLKPDIQQFLRAAVSAIK